jgi:hypothetical protein
VSGAVGAARHFSRTYVEARDKFLAAARVCGIPVETHLLPDLRGVDGEPLAMDVARLGDAGAPGMLLLWSATHGIEGYCGSGCQTGLLNDDAFIEAVAAAGVAALFVHAVNPHGFSFGRRVNEDNIDLNRNFRDFAAPAPVNAAYAEIHRLLLPATWPPDAANERELGAWIAAHGERAYQAAVSGGQYAFPDGLFYGGTGASWSNRTLRSVLRAHAARRTSLGLIDFHTGLGPRGHGEKIFNGANVVTDIARARSWWGADVTSFHDGSSTSAPLVGVNYNAVYDECTGVEYAGIALEYGALPLLATLQALRADHWRHNHPEAPAALETAIRREVREAFYVEADDWKDIVYAQARVAALAGIARLARSMSG